MSKISSLKFFWKGLDHPPTCLDNVFKYALFFWRYPLIVLFLVAKTTQLVSMFNRFISIFIWTKFTWIPVWYSLWVWSAVDPNGIIVGQLIWEYHRIPDILCQNQIKTQHTKRGATHSSQNMTIKCTWLICLVLCRFCGSWTVAASTTNSRIPAQYHSRNTGWKC